jgi:hypothetical protein
MNRHSGSTCLILIAYGAGLLGFARPAQALKLENFRLEQVVLGNQWPEIHVNFDRAADDWTQVTGDDVVVNLDFRIDVKASYALAPGSELSVSVDNMNKDVPLQSSNNHYNETHSGRIVLRRSGNALNDIKSLALTTCHTIRGNGGKPSKEHRIAKRFEASAWASTSTTAPVFTEENANKKAAVDVIIVCNKDPGWHGPIVPDSLDLDSARGRFKPSSIQVFLTTYQNQVSHPSPGVSCKKLEVKVRIEANKVGSVTYKLWRQPGEPRTRAHTVTFHDSGPFKGRFIAEDVFVETFEKTTYVQYMAEIGGSPFGVSTQWKDINIICTSGGGGGLKGGSPPGGGDQASNGAFKAPPTAPPPPPPPTGKKIVPRSKPR